MDQFQPTILFLLLRRAPIGRFGRWDCEILLRSPFSQAALACSLTTSVKTPGKRLMMALRARIMAGPLARARALPQTPIFGIPCFNTRMGQPRRRAAQSLAVDSTIHPPFNFRQVSLASTFSRISVPDGFACSIRRITQQRILPQEWQRLWI